MLSFDFVDRGSKFQNYDKFGGRYDIREVASWLPKISIGAYRQYYERSQNDTQSALGGSFATVTTFGPTGPVSTTQYTGQSSTFTKSLETDTVDHNETLGGDLQLNIIPFHNAQFTTGATYSKDKFDGNVAQRAFSATGVQTSSISGVTNVPDTDYKNIGWFNQLELFPSPHIRFSAGVRLDNWKSEAKPTTGFATTTGGAFCSFYECTLLFS